MPNKLYSIFCGDESNAIKTYQKSSSGKSVVLLSIAKSKGVDIISNKYDRKVNAADISACDKIREQLFSI